MDKHNRLDTLDHRAPAGRNRLLLGLWMRSALGGAAFAAAAFASLIDPPRGVPSLTALTWIAAGGTLAWLARQRSAALLDQVTRTNRANLTATTRRRCLGLRVPVSSRRTAPPNCVSCSTLG
jgi:hypothetical protein